MKYIIDLPEEFAEATKEYWDKTVGTQLEPYIESDRECIENEVWKFLAFLIDEMDPDEKYECFGISSAYKIVSNMSYNEAKVKYEAWLKQKNQVRVGEEVEYEDCKFIVTAEIGDMYHGIHSSNGDIVGFGEGDYCRKDNCRKTGRYFPEVAELLEKMRDKSNENS